MNKPQALLVGGGGNAIALLDLLDEMPFEIVGFLDEDASRTELCGMPYLGSDDDAPRLFAEGVTVAIITVAAPCSLRAKLAARYRKIGYELPTLVSTHAFVSARAELGEGATVFPKAVVGAGCTIGPFATVNVGAAVTHGVDVGACSHIAPNATLLGSVRVGEETLVGGASVVLPGVHVGSHATVGAGSVVLSNIADGCVVAGNPARTIR